MNPDDISRLADQEKKRKKEEDSKPVKEPFNPLDWMDFTRTRKWMGRNLKLSDRFYGYLAFLLMLMVVSFWIWWDRNWDNSTWEYFAFISFSLLFFISCIFGFIYGYRKAHRKQL